MGSQTMFFFNYASMSSINLNPWPILPQILLVAKLYQGYPGSQKELFEVALEQLVADLYKKKIILDMISQSQLSRPE